MQVIMWGKHELPHLKGDRELDLNFQNVHIAVTVAFTNVILICQAPTVACRLFVQHTSHPAFPVYVVQAFIFVQPTGLRTY